VRLLLMRHGEAGFDAPSDFDRVLTPRGRVSIGSLINANIELFQQVEVVVHSPYVRAQQTAQLVMGSAGHDIEPVVSGDFTPDSDLTAAMAALEAYQDCSSLLLVTHQPLIGRLASLLIEGDARYPEPMAPGDVLAIDFEIVVAGCGLLQKRLIA